MVPYTTNPPNTPHLRDYIQYSSAGVLGCGLIHRASLQESKLSSEHKGKLACKAPAHIFGIFKSIASANVVITYVANSATASTATASTVVTMDGFTFVISAFVLLLHYDIQWMWIDQHLECL